MTAVGYTSRTISVSHDHTVRYTGRTTVSHNYCEVHWQDCTVSHDYCEVHWQDCTMSHDYTGILAGLCMESRDYCEVHCPRTYCMEQDCLTMLYIYWRSSDLRVVNPRCTC